MKFKLYVLKGRVPVRVENSREWAAGVHRGRVAYDDFSGVEVSTCFLGIDHNHGDGDPLLFETVVMDGLLDGEMRRYSTWEQAAAGHLEMVARVRATVVSERGRLAWQAIQRAPTTETPLALPFKGH